MPDRALHVTHLIPLRVDEPTPTTFALAWVKTTQLICDDARTTGDWILHDRAVVPVKMFASKCAPSEYWAYTPADIPRVGNVKRVAVRGSYSWRRLISIHSNSARRTPTCIIVPAQLSNMLFFGFWTRSSVSPLLTLLPIQRLSWADHIHQHITLVRTVKKFTMN